MNKIELCIFDIDGVLVDTSELHYPATKAALSEFGYYYSREEDNELGTIPTKEKLIYLANKNKISYDDITTIWSLKNDFACNLFSKVKINNNIKPIFELLKNKQIKIALASNTRYSFIEKIIDSLQIQPLVDYYVSSQDCPPKPKPDMYLKVMNKFFIRPDSTLIFEDSKVGLEAAYASKAWVYEVKLYNELSTNILEDGKFKNINNVKPWAGEICNTIYS